MRVTALPATKLPNERVVVAAPAGGLQLKPLDSSLRAPEEGVDSHPRWTHSTECSRQKKAKPGG